MLLHEDFLLTVFEVAVVLLGVDILLVVVLDFPFPFVFLLLVPGMLLFPFLPTLAWERSCLIFSIVFLNR